MADRTAVLPVRAQISGRLKYRDKRGQVIKEVDFQGSLPVRLPPDALENQETPTERPRDGDTS